MKSNRDIVTDAFHSWANGTGYVTSIFADDMTWEITGRSAVSKKYANTRQFIDQVLHPFGARFSSSDRNDSVEPAIIAGSSNFDEICQATHEYALGQRPLFGMGECAATLAGRGRTDHPDMRRRQANGSGGLFRAERRIRRSWNGRHGSKRARPVSGGYFCGQLSRASFAQG
jgi:hypothetical protein